MKKGFIFLLILVLVLTVSGCGNSDKEGSITKDQANKTEQTEGNVKELPPLSQEEYKAALEGLVTEKNRAYATYTIDTPPSKDKGKYVPTIKIESDEFTDEQRCRSEFESFFGKMVDNNYQFYAPTVQFEFLANSKVTYTMTVEGSDQLKPGSSFDRFQLEKK